VAQEVAACPRQTGPAAGLIFQQMPVLHYRFRLGSYCVLGRRKDVARRVKLTGGPQKSEERARQTMSRPRRKQSRGVGAAKPPREASANPQRQATVCRSNLPPPSETSFQLRVACSH
jgi:hypothetical protein